MISNKDFAIFILQIEKERLLLQEKMIKSKSNDEKLKLEKKMRVLLNIINSICNYIDIEI